MPWTFLDVPRPRSAIRTAGWAAGLTLAAFAAWFFWFDTWFALGHSLGALQAMHDSAERLAAKGDFVEAENLLRESLAIHERRAIRGFDFGTGEELALEASSQLAFVVAARGRRGEARRLHDEAVARAARVLDGDPYGRYRLARLQSRHGELLLLLGDPAAAREALEGARVEITRLRPEADAHLLQFVEALDRLNQERLRRAGD